MFQTLFDRGISLAGMAISKRAAAKEKAAADPAAQAKSALEAHEQARPSRMSASFRDYYEQRLVDLSRAAYEAAPSTEGAQKLGEAMGAQEATARRKERALERQQRMQREAEEAKLVEQRRAELTREIMRGGD